MNYVTPRVIPTTKTVNTPAVNTAAVVTLAAPGAGLRTVIQSITWSYTGGAAPAGRLTITDGGVTVLDVDITTAPPAFWDVPTAFNANSAVVVTLATGGAAYTGKLTVHSYTEPSAPNVALS